MRCRFSRALVSLARIEVLGRSLKSFVTDAHEPGPHLSARLDELSWIARGPAMRPSPQRMAADKAFLLSKLKEPRATRRRIAVQPPPIVGALATAGILIGVATGTNAATTGLPTPVKDMFSSVEMLIGMNANAGPESARDERPWLGEPATY